MKLIHKRAFPLPRLILAECYYFHLTQSGKKQFVMMPEIQIVDLLDPSLGIIM